MIACTKPNTPNNFQYKQKCYDYILGIVAGGNRGGRGNIK